MIDIYSIAEDIRFRTSLLESLEWDEDLLETFLIYFDGEIKNGNKLEKFISGIKENFGEATFNIIVELIKEEASVLDEYSTKDGYEVNLFFKINCLRLDLFLFKTTLSCTDINVLLCHYLNIRLMQKLLL